MILHTKKRQNKCQDSQTFDVKPAYLFQAKLQNVSSLLQAFQEEYNMENSKYQIICNYVYRGKTTQGNS